ncbi:hypothetical protein [Paraburkholderia phenoliruptrix]|uniref:Uncharacterized protein n=1 Tax=Paraburkholderia phenoliruptrix TaxID=252970 RepID=A0ABV3W855_9BURK
MKRVKKAVLASACALALVGTAFAQGAGGGGSSGGGGSGSGGTSVGAGGAGVNGANGAGQGGAGMSAPNMGGTSGSTSTMKSGKSKHAAPTRMPQNGAHAKGASDTAASTAQ